MAMIHVNRGATSLGAFSEEEVREGLRTGRFAPTDIGWREGMANWQPLSQFPELGAAAPAAPPPHRLAQPALESTSPRSGLPWDHRQERGFFNAFIETLVMVLTKPGEAFTAMKREGGLGEPLIYALIGGCVGGVVSFLFSLGLQSVGFFADRHNDIRGDGRDGHRLRCIYYSPACVHRNLPVHRQRDRASLFDDRWRRKSII